MHFFLFRGLANGKAQLNHSENLGNYGTKPLGTKILPMVTIHNGALFESHNNVYCFYFPRGCAYAKLNLIFLKIYEILVRKF